MRIYDVCNHFYENDETKFSKKVKIFVKPPIRRDETGNRPTLKSTQDYAYAHDEILPENVRLISCTLRSSAGQRGAMRFCATRTRSSSFV